MATTLRAFAGRALASISMGLALLAVTLLPGIAHAIVIPVVCANVGQVGSIDVEAIVTPQQNGVAGFFAPSINGQPISLQDAATRCGEDHFNWYQEVRGTHPGIPPGGDPQVDPLLGGQLGLWADQFPWYWNEDVPSADNPGPLRYDPTLSLIANTDEDSLTFFDYPFTNVAGTHVMYQTWLASVNGDGSLHDLHGGFSWCWSNVTGVVTVCDPVSLVRVSEPASLVLFVPLLCLLVLSTMLRRRRARARLVAVIAACS